MGAWTGARTGGGELGIETFAHDALQTHAGADEPDGDKGEGVGPCGVAAVVGDAGGAALPEDDGAAHCEESLDKGAEGHPQAGLAPDLVPDASEEGAEDEGEHGAEGLLIGNVKGVVVLAVEEPRQGECKLWRGSAGGARDGRRTYLYRVACLEGAPNEYRRKGHCIAGEWVSDGARSAVERRT